MGEVAHQILNCKSYTNPLACQRVAFKRDVRLKPSSSVLSTEMCRESKETNDITDMRYVPGYITLPTCFSFLFLKLPL